MSNHVAVVIAFGLACGDGGPPAGDERGPVAGAERRSVVGAPTVGELAGAAASGRVAEVADGEATRWRRVGRPELAAMLDAIGPDRRPDGTQRRCRVDVALRFDDAAGAELGGLRICGRLDRPADGIELYWPGGRSGIAVADEPALRARLAAALETARTW